MCGPWPPISRTPHLAGLGARTSQKMECLPDAIRYHRIPQCGASLSPLSGHRQCHHRWVWLNIPRVPVIHRIQPRQSPLQHILCSRISSNCQTKPATTCMWSSEVVCSQHHPPQLIIALVAQRFYDVIQSQTDDVGDVLQKQQCRLEFLGQSHHMAIERGCIVSVSAAWIVSWTKKIPGPVRRPIKLKP